jgi:hypothetical protein
MLSIYEQDEKFTQGEEYRRMRSMYASPSQVLTDMVLKLVRGKYAPNVPTAKLPKYAKTNNRPKTYYDLSELLVSPLYRKTMCRYLQRMDQDVTTLYDSAFRDTWRQRSQGNTLQRSTSIGSSVDTAVPELTSSLDNRPLRLSHNIVGPNGGFPICSISDQYVQQHPGMPPGPPPVMQIQASPRPEGVSQGTQVNYGTGSTIGTQTGNSGAAKTTQTGKTKTKNKGMLAKPGTASKATQDGPRAVVSQETQTTARKAEGALSYVNRLKNTTIQQDNDIRELNLLVDDLNDEVSKLEKKLGEADAAANTECARMCSEIAKLNDQLEVADKYKDETVKNLILLQEELKVQAAEIASLLEAKQAGVDVALILNQDLKETEQKLLTAEKNLRYLEKESILQKREIVSLENKIASRKPPTMVNRPTPPLRGPTTTENLVRKRPKEEVPDPKKIKIDLTAGTSAEHAAMGPQPMDTGVDGRGPMAVDPQINTTPTRNVSTLRDLFEGLSMIGETIRGLANSAQQPMAPPAGEPMSLDNQLNATAQEDVQQGIAGVINPAQGQNLGLAHGRSTAGLHFNRDPNMEYDMDNIDFDTGEWIGDPRDPNEALD